MRTSPHFRTPLQHWQHLFQHLMSYSRLLRILMLLFLHFHCLYDSDHLQGKVFVSDSLWFPAMGEFPAEAARLTSSVVCPETRLPDLPTLETDLHGNYRQESKNRTWQRQKPALIKMALLEQMSNLRVISLRRRHEWTVNMSAH